MKKLLLIILSAIGFFSCSTVEKTNSIKAIDIYGVGVIHRPVIVDLDVQENKITAIITVKGGLSNETVKDLVIAEALKNSKADVLVEPRFEIERKNGRISAVVTGFPAFYKNFRSISPEDIPLIERGQVQEATIVTQAPLKKRGK